MGTKRSGGWTELYAQVCHQEIRSQKLLPLNISGVGGGARCFYQVEEPHYLPNRPNKRILGP